MPDAWPVPCTVRCGEEPPQPAGDRSVVLAPASLSARPRPAPPISTAPIVTASTAVPALRGRRSRIWSPRCRSALCRGALSGRAPLPWLHLLVCGHTRDASARRLVPFHEHSGVAIIVVPAQLRPPSDRIGADAGPTGRLGLPDEGAACQCLDVVRRSAERGGKPHGDVLQPPTACRQSPSPGHAARCSTASAAWMTAVAPSSAWRTSCRGGKTSPDMFLALT